MTLPLYLLSVLVAPKKIINKIKSLQHKFLWGGAERVNKWTRVAWERVCLPKIRGGVGIIRDISIMNKALAGKRRWKWLKNSKILREV